MTTYYAIVEGDPLTSDGNSQVIEGNRSCTIDDQEGRSRAQTFSLSASLQREPEYRITFEELTIRLVAPRKQ